MTFDRHSGSSPNPKGRHQGAAQRGGPARRPPIPAGGPGCPSGQQFRDWGLQLQRQGLVSAGLLACAQSGMGVAPEAREWEVFIFISAHHVLCLSQPGWERRAPLGDAPLWHGGGDKDHRKFSRAC